MKKVIIAANEVIRLKSWDIENASELFNLTDKNRRHLEPWLPWVPGVKEVTDSAKFITTSIEEMKKDLGLELGIWFLTKLIGCIGLHGLSKPNRRASLGYWLDKDYLGKGIMTRSVKALIDFSFIALDLNRIAIEASPENISSCAIAEKLNFVKEGIVRQFEFVNGRFLDYQIYSLLKSEWKK